MHNGFLYVAIDRLLNFLRHLNLVEALKWLARRLAPRDCCPKRRRGYTRTAVDLFIAGKWLYLLILWLCQASAPLLVGSVWYLLTANLYTYFYYHTWADETLRDVRFDTDRVKRRFANLVLAILYAVLGFAYFYHIPYSQNFEWCGRAPGAVPAIWFSISNSLTASYDQVRPVTDVGYAISMVQLVMMFVFLTIIVGGSVPQINPIPTEE